MMTWYQFKVMKCQSVVITTDIREDRLHSVQWPPLHWLHWPTLRGQWSMAHMLPIFHAVYDYNTHIQSHREAATDG